MSDISSFFIEVHYLELTALEPLGLPSLAGVQPPADTQGIDSSSIGSYACALSVRTRPHDYGNAYISVLEAALNRSVE